MIETCMSTGSLFYNAQITENYLFRFLAYSMKWISLFKTWQKTIPLQLIYFYSQWSFNIYFEWTYLYKSKSRETNISHLSVRFNLLNLEIWNISICEA